MSLFPATIRAHLEGVTVRMSYMVMLDFRSGPMRVWTGFGVLHTGGHDWSGLGEIGQIDGLEQAINGEAPQTNLILSGVEPEIVRIARDQFATEARSRSVQVSLQFHNDTDDRPLRTYDQPYPIWQGQMRTAQFEAQADGLRRITIGCESLFSLRSRPNWAMYTDKDQRQRFPGDRGFEFVNSLIHKVVTWPTF